MNLDCRGFAKSLIGIVGSFVVGQKVVMVLLVALFSS